MKSIRIVFVALLILLGLIAGLFWLKGQKTEGMRFVEQMGAGINIGNSLDVKGIRERKPDASVQDYETYWGNPPISEELLHSVKESGFDSVRIPVSWGEHLDENGIVDPEWMARVRQVVDMAMEEGLYVILDLHHEPWITPTEAEEERVKQTLCSVWAQIAQQFQDCGEKLLFESMNEPRLIGSDVEWNGGTAEMQQVVNRLNDAFVETIRASGGENEKRYLILPGYGHSSKPSALDAIRLPGDRRLMVAVHAYLPYAFALQEEGTDQWSEQNEKDSAPIAQLMTSLKERFIDKDIPVIITEYGCADKDNPTQRQAWTRYYVSQAGRNGIGLFWWDQGGDMKLFDRDSGACVQEDLVSILTGVFFD